MAKQAYHVVELRSRIADAFGSISPVHRDGGHYYRLDRTGRETASVTTKIGSVGAKPYLRQWAVNQGIEHVESQLPRLLEGDLSVLDEGRTAHKAALELAGDTGTRAHEAIDRAICNWIESGTRPASSVGFLREDRRSTEIAACRSFDKFASENEIIPIASEIKVWYEEGRTCFAGTVDFIFLRFEVYKGRGGSLSGTHEAHDYEIQEKDKRLLWCVACGREVKVSLILGDWKTSNSIKGKSDYAIQTVAYAKAIEKATRWKFDDIWVIRFSKERAEYEILKVADKAACWREWLAYSKVFDLIDSRSEMDMLVPLKERLVIRV